MIDQPSIEILDTMVRAETKCAGPLHAQLKRVLRLAIDDHFENGQRFWPENLLINRLGMSQNTVRRALGDLAQEGVLERQVAKGSFVRKVVDPATTGIGALVAQHNSEFLSECVERLSGMCREQGFRFQVQPTHRGENVQEVLRHLKVGPPLKRFVLLGNPTVATGELWDALSVDGGRVVCIDTPAEGRPAHFVGVDNAQAIRLAVEFLRDLGHQRIVFIANEPSNHPSVIAREQAFLALSEELQLPHAHVVSCQTRPWEDSGKAVLRIMPDLWKKRPTALITASDVGAWAAMSWLSQNGISVPKEVSVIGFDNERPSQFTSPTLTSIAQPFSEISRWTLKLLEDSNATPQHILLEAELVQRRSTAPVSA